MPGVFGGCSMADGSAVPTPILRTMSAALRVEDPGGSSVPVGSPAGIGVVDPGIRTGLATARDFPERRLAIALYGQLYNEPGGEGDPAAALAEWYAADPASAPERAVELDGSFVIAIHDYGRRQLLLVNDPTGTRPIYFATIGRALYFAPELRGLACVPGFDDSVDLGCLVSLLANGFWINDRTLYRDVRSLPQASALRVRDGRVEVTRYWTFDFDEDAPDEGLRTYVEELAPLLRGAIARRVEAIPDPAGMVVPISGGYDSRGILAAIREIYDGPLKTVTWGTSESDPEADGHLGRRVAEALGTEHHFLPRRGSGSLERDVLEMVDRLEGSNDDPMNHRTELVTMRRIRELGATDLFRGDKLYGYHPPVETDAEALRSIGFVQAKDLGPVLSVLEPALREPAREAYDAAIQEFRGDTNLRDPSNRKDYYYYAGLLRHLLHRSSYYKFGVLDVKLPWLDREILDFYKRVPVRYRMEKLLYIKTIEHMYPALREIPYATRHSLENWGDEIRTDPELRTLIRSVLLERRNPFDTFVEPGRVRDFVDGSLADPAAVPLRDSAVGRIRDLVRRASPSIYRRLKRHLIPRMAVPHASPVPLLFRMVIAKLWFGDRTRTAPSGPSPAS